MGGITSCLCREQSRQEALEQQVEERRQPYLREVLERDLKERREQAVREKRDREVRETREREATERREEIDKFLHEHILKQRERREKQEQEVREKREQEVREKREQEVREKREQEVKQEREQEVKEKGEQEVRETQEGEVKEKREREARESQEEKPLKLEQNRRDERIIVEERAVAIVYASPKLEPVVSNPKLVKDLLRHSEYASWSYSMNDNDNSLYQLLPLADNSPEYNIIKTYFTTTNKKCFHITSVKKIINPYLLLQYKLMKDRYRQLYTQVIEMTLFHGTREANVPNICMYNFNWRLRGRSRGHKFGQGVSFTPISNYATHYGDKTYAKVMIVAYVLVSNCCLGHESAVLPSGNCDTTTNDNKHVFVKYEDNTFYPCYVINYEGYDSKPTSTRGVDGRY